MFRRKRRRSAFSRRAAAAGRGYWLAGLGAFALIALFVFFIRQADVLAPTPQEMRVELPNAFKN